MHKDLSWLRIFVLLLRMQLLRWRHRIFQGKKKFRSGLILLLLIPAFLGIHVVMLGFIHRLLDPTQVRETLFKQLPLLAPDPLRFTLYDDVSDQGARLMILFLCLTLLSGLLTRLGRWQSSQRDLEWEWFAEQAIPPLPLFINRCLVESILPQWVSFYIWPFFTMLCWMRGVPVFLAPFYGLLLLVLMQAMIAAPRLCFDLWMRSHLKASTMRNIQAILGFMGLAMLMLSMQSMQSDRAFSTSIIQGWGPWLDHMPPSLGLSAVLLRDPFAAAQAFFELVAVTIGIHGIVYALAAAWLKKPLEPLMGWESGRGKKKQAPGSGTDAWEFIHPLLRRDFLHLLRDRHFMIQMLLAPLLFSLMPLISLGDPEMVGFLRESKLILPMAFMAGILFLMGAVAQLLHMEGQGIWLLMVVPQPLHRLLEIRLKFWFGLSIFYASLLLLVAALQFELALTILWPRILGLVGGLAAFTFIIGAMTVFAYKAGQQQRENRPNLLMNYLILFLAAGYSWCLAQGSLMIMGVLLTILFGLAIMLWRRILEYLPRLLDPKV